jgi:predicted ATP-dependent endonuclease of OLD family
LKFENNGTHFKIAKDILTQKCKFVQLEIRENEIIEKGEIGRGKLVRSVIGEKPKIKLHKPEEIDVQVSDIIPFSRYDKFPPNTLLAQTASFFMAHHRNFFYDILIYDFDPKLPKKAAPITGKAELEENGSNLSIILRNILSDKEKKRKFFNLVNDLLPFISNLDVEKSADTSLLLKLQEIYHENRYLHASFISDGTINITALIVALYFEKKDLTIIEEPERNIHPSLISRVVDMMKDASHNKQIILTTHNPEIVKHAGLENLLFISRNKKGFSFISRPGDKKEIQTFLKNEIGIEELFLQNLLGV